MSSNLGLNHVVKAQLVYRSPKKETLQLSRLGKIFSKITSFFVRSYFGPFLSVSYLCKKGKTKTSPIKWKTLYFDPQGRVLAAKRKFNFDPISLYSDRDGNHPAEIPIGQLNLNEKSPVTTEQPSWWEIFLFFFKKERSAKPEPDIHSETAPATINCRITKLEDTTSIKSFFSTENSSDHLKKVENLEKIYSILKSLTPSIYNTEKKRPRFALSNPQTNEEDIVFPEKTRNNCHSQIKLIVFSLMLTTLVSFGFWLLYQKIAK